MDLNKTLNLLMVESGEIVLMGFSKERLIVQGSIDEANLRDFFETMMRASPGLHSIIKEAVEDTECPVS